MQRAENRADRLPAVAAQRRRRGIAQDRRAFSAGIVRGHVACSAPDAIGLAGAAGLLAQLEDVGWTLARGPRGVTPEGLEARTYPRVLDAAAQLRRLLPVVAIGLQYPRGHHQV